MSDIKCPKCRRDHQVDKIVDEMFDKVWGLFHDSVKSNNPTVSDEEYPTYTRLWKNEFREKLHSLLKEWAGPVDPC